MRAAVLFGPRDIRVVERLVPLPGPDEVLVRVAMCGTCGTDLKIFDGHFPQVPHIATRTSTSSGPGNGTGRSMTRMSRGPNSTAARMTSGMSGRGRCPAAKSGSPAMPASVMGGPDDADGIRGAWVAAGGAPNCPGRRRT